MTQFQPIWTLADYERFLSHPESDLRFWAKTHLRQEYPAEAPRLISRLIHDPNAMLQFSAIEALGAMHDPESEATLLAFLLDVDDNNQGWITHFLAQRQSAQFLPMLLAQVTALDLTTPTPGHPFIERMRVEAVGEYTDPQAMAALWRLLEGYRWDSRFQESIYGALLRHPDAERLPRLLTRLVQLRKVNDHEQASAWRVIAGTLGMRRLFEELADNDDLPALLAEIEEWWGVAPFSDALLSAIQAAYAGDTVLPLLVDQFQQVAAGRGDQLAAWLASWQSGVQTVGYQQRTLYGWQILTTLAQLPLATAAPYHRLAARALAVLILGQYLHDENDEARLAATTTDEQRRAALLAILASPRPNVRETEVDEVAALGPTIVPDLRPILQGDPYWPVKRTLKVVKVLAQAHPGAVDALIPTLIDLLREDRGDYINEGCANALRAIGPAVVKPLAAALNAEDEALEIYGIGVLGDIPVQASVDALEQYFTEQGEIDTGQWEQLLNLGHRQSIKFLRQFYDGKNPRLANALHTLGLLHGLETEEMTAWAEVVEDDRLARESESFGPATIRRGLDFMKPQPMLYSVTVHSAKEDAARKARKKKRDQAKATKKAQQKGKKKKKR
jgi:HEAT repeat protein